MGIGRRGKQIIALIVAGIFLIFAIAPVMSRFFSKSSNKEAEQATLFQPLSTTSNKVVAEYTGGKVTEGEVNKLVNIEADKNKPLALQLNNKNMLEVLKYQVISTVALGKFLLAKCDKAELEKYHKRFDEFVVAKKVEGQRIDFSIEKNGFTLADLAELEIAKELERQECEKRVAAEKYTELDIRHILVKVDPKAKEPKERLEAAKKVATKDGINSDAAQSFSDDPIGVNNGGKLDVPEIFGPAFMNACLKQKGLTIVKSELGYHIVEYRGKKEKLGKDAAPMRRKLLEAVAKNKIIAELKLKILLPKPKLEAQENNKGMERSKKN